MAYTIEQFNKDLKCKFGDRFQVGSFVVRGITTVTFSVKNADVHQPVPANNLPVVVSGCFKSTRSFVWPQCFSDGQLTHGGLVATTDSCMPIFAATINPARLKKLAKTVINDLVETYNNANQQLLMARNEIAYALEREKEAFHGTEGKKQNLTGACDALLKSVDKLMKGEGDIVNMIHHTKRIMDINGNAYRVEAAVCAFAVLAALACCVVIIATTGIIPGLVAAVVGLGLAVGLRVYAKYDEERWISASIATNFSKVGRLSNHFTTLFTKQTKAEQAQAPGQALPMAFAS